MAFPSVTYTFANSTTADATQVNQNFTDLINGASDGTKSYNIAALTTSGTASLQGSVSLGVSSANLLTWNASLASSIPIQTTNAYDIGADALGLRSIYFGSGSSAHSTRLIGASVSSAWTLTLPTSAGSNLQILQTDGTGATSWTTARKSSDWAANYSLNTSAGSNNLTISLKDSSGADASASSTVDVLFRNTTAATGTPQLVNVSSAMSIVVPSGATLGLISAINQYIYVYLIQDTSNELAVCGSRFFDDGSLQSATAITSGSTSNNVLYATSNHTSRPIKYLGRVQSNQTVSGTYGSNATEIAVNQSLPPIITDWTAYTPTLTGFGTATTVKFLWRRMGDTLEVLGNFTTGTVAASIASITLPGSLTMESTKLPESSNTTSNAGTAVGVYAGQGGGGAGSLVTAYQTSSSLIYFGSGWSQSGVSFLVPVNGTGTQNSLNEVSVKFAVPVSGWSASR